MERRAFLKAVLGVAVAPCLPQTKPKIEACFKPVSSYKGEAPNEFGRKIRWRRYAKLKVPTTPPNINWKVQQRIIILNDSPIRILKVTT